MSWKLSTAVLLLSASSSLVVASSPGAAFEIGVPIVSAEGYEWTDRQRSYWPTNSWISGSVSDYFEHASAELIMLFRFVGTAERNQQSN